MLTVLLIYVLVTRVKRIFTKMFGATMFGA